MTLLEICEPLFLKVCELNRMARLNQSQDYDDLRSEIKGLLDGICQPVGGYPLRSEQVSWFRAEGGDAKLVAQAKQIVLPLTCFVDSMIATSSLRLAGKWQDDRLAKERFNELGGDDRFFDLLEQTLNDSSDEASERSAVFYICLGLGFVGPYAGQPDQLQTYMRKIVPRIRHLIDLDTKAKLCPDAYKALDTRTLTEPPINPMVPLTIGFAFLCLAVVVVYYSTYHSATKNLNASVTTILSHGSFR